MAVVQIAKIQIRRGLQEDLPTLDAGELGWSTDTLRLFIGNGSTGDPDYAPVPGNTEILTVYSSQSDILAIQANVAALQSNVSILQANVASLLSSGGIQSITLKDNAASTADANIQITNSDTNIFDYRIFRGTTSRVGTIKVTQYNGSVVYEDDYSETASTGVTLSFAGNAVTNTANLSYTTTSTSSDATFTYYRKSFV